MTVMGAALSCALLLVTLTPTHAQTPYPTFSPGFKFTETTGEALYANVCQGCHMPDGRGASGAGTYPALAGDSNLATPGYPVYVVLNGLHGMPPVGAMMSDEQVAAVVNYVRSHFGNAYTDEVTADDAKAARPKH
jgi:mono/diheme cytochrome c family protein